MNYFFCIEFIIPASNANGAFQFIAISLVEKLQMASR